MKESPRGKQRPTTLCVVVAGIVCLVLLIGGSGCSSKKKSPRKARVGERTTRYKTSDTKKRDIAKKQPQTEVAGKDTGTPETAQDQNPRDTDNPHPIQHPDPEEDTTDAGEDDAPDPVDPDSFQQRLAKAQLSPERERVAEYLDLAHWCEQNGLSERRNQVHQMVIDIDPNNLTARAALGYIRHGATWLTEEDARGMGLIPHEGRWWTTSELEERGLAVVDGKVADKKPVEQIPKPDNVRPEQPKTLAWLTSPAEAFVQAKERKTLIFAVVSSKNCGWCVKLENTTLQNPLFQEIAAGLVLLKIDAAQQPDFCNKHGVNGFPTLFLLDEKQSEIQRIDGYVEIAALLPALQQGLAKSQKGEVPGKIAQPKTLQETEAPELYPESILNNDGRVSIAAHRGDIVVLESYGST